MKAKAFSLIELLIVVAIIGILAAIATPNFLNAQVRANLAKTYVNLKTIRSAIASYYIDNGWAPPTYFDDNWKYGKSYIPLTTPVSYLNTIEFGRETSWAGSKRNKPGYMNYGSPLDFERQDLFDYRYEEFKEANVTYIQLSIGPNQRYDHPHPQIHYGVQYTELYWNEVNDFFYQTSNGLVSHGDIIITSSKLYQ